MYAIIETGGKQYRVVSGQTMAVEKLESEGEVVFDKVLAVGGDGNMVTGNPYVEKASVTAEVISAGKTGKVLVFKQKQRKGHRKLRGHRQPYTEVRIKEIKIGG
ncbi:MAG: 50S ribosomal protein L21 [Actinomycetota bacterium]|nr:50S ribosomal protein L21 [Actinomycetota bacterium]MDA8173464.1 50S ribosomal protein L21 [Nitrospiraceae bacterium]